MANKDSKKSAPAEEIKSTEALAPVAPAGALAPVFNEYGDEAGTGLKEVPANEKSIPFYNLLQTNSPEVENKTIPGAEGGMFVNSVSKELISGEKGFIIQPVFIDRFFVEWVDRDKGGGLVARHLYTSAIVQDAIERNDGQEIATKDKPLKHGENFLVDTRYLYFNVLDNETGTEVIGYGVIAGSKSKVKPVQDFVTACDNTRGKPMIWMIRAKVTSFQDKNKKTGKLFKNLRFLPAFEGKGYFESRVLGKLHPEVTEADLRLYAAGKSLRESILKGQMKADFNAESLDGTATDEGAEERRHF